MRSFLAGTAVAALLSGLGLAQDRTFYFTQSHTQDELTSIVTLMRTVTSVPDIKIDADHQALVTHGTVDQMMLTEWLVQELDAPAAVAPPEYRMAGPDGDAVRVFRLDAALNNADLTAMVTAIRTIVDAQRLFPYTPRKFIVVRTSKVKMDATAWLIGQTYQPAGTTVASSPGYPMEDGGHAEVVRVFRLAANTSNQTLTETITAIRTVADVQRMFPMESQRAIVMRGPAERVAAAEWLINELSDNSKSTTHEYGLTLDSDKNAGYLVRVFRLTNPANTEEMKTLVTDIRGNVGIQRVFPITAPKAVVLLGPPDKMAILQAMVSKFDQR